jgi:Flp pilus assembly protein TadG
MTCRSKQRADAGMVTAEIAVAMPVLMVLLGAALTGLVAIGGKLGCVDAAREAARALARGDSVNSARSLVREAGPRGATLTATVDKTQVRATVRSRIAPAGLLPGLTVSAEAVASPEPGSGEP